MTLKRALFIAACAPHFLALTACQPTAQSKGDSKSQFKDDSEA